MDCITYQLTTVVEKEIEMEQITKLIIKEANITFFQLKKDIGRKKKDYNEKLSLLGMSVLGTNFYAKTKKRMWFDYEKNCFKPRSEWFNNNDPYFEYNM